MPHKTPLPVRFWRRVDKSGGPDACWPYTGCVKIRNGKRGYGWVFIEKPSGGKHVTRATHRVAWELTNGSIPDGLCVLHACDNPPCCNPAHLSLGTQLDNIADRQRRGRCNSGIRLREKTHCPKGHEYADETTYRHDGKRTCRVCRQDRRASEKETAMHTLTKEQWLTLKDNITKQSVESVGGVWCGHFAWPMSPAEMAEEDAFKTPRYHIRYTAHIGNRVAVYTLPWPFRPDVRKEVDMYPAYAEAGK